jgi:hypothetical protein
MRDVEQLIREVNGTMAIEGMPLTDEDKNKMREVLRGEVSFEAMRNSILAEYMPKLTAYE